MDIDGILHRVNPQLLEIGEFHVRLQVFKLQALLMVYATLILTIWYSSKGLMIFFFTSVHLHELMLNFQESLRREMSKSCTSAGRFTLIQIFSVYFSIS